MLVMTLLPLASEQSPASERLSYQYFLVKILLLKAVVGKNTEPWGV